MRLSHGRQIFGKLLVLRRGLLRLGRLLGAGALQRNFNRPCCRRRSRCFVVVKLVAGNAVHVLAVVAIELNLDAMQHYTIVFELHFL